MAPQQLLVLDINDRTVAGLTAEVHKHSYVPAAAHVASIGDGETVAGAVRAVVEQCGGSGLSCHISLPPSIFYFRNLTLPFTDRRKIDEILHYELIDSLGLGDEPIHYDAVPIASDGNRTTLLSAVVIQKELDQLLSTIQELALEPRVITVSGFSVALQMIESGYGADRPVVYLDAGRFESSAFVSENGRIRSVRGLCGVGAEQFVQLGEEVRRTLLALNIADDCPIFIGGSAGSDKDTAQQFREQSGFDDVVLVDMEDMEDMEDREDREDREDGEGGFAADALPGTRPIARLPRHLQSKLSTLLQVDPADGRLINLALERRGSGSGLRLVKRFAPVLAICLAVLIAIAGYQLYDFNKILNKRTVLVEQAEQIFSQTLDGRQAQVDPVQELRAEIGALEQSAAVSIIGNPEISAVAVLSDLSGRIPPSVRVGFDRFLFDRRQVHIDGVTDAYNDVDAIRKSLAQSTLYSAVTIDSARNAQNGDGVRFSLILKL